MAKVTIDGKEYESESLSQEAQDNILNLRYCDQRLVELRREVAIAQTARNAYAQALAGQLPKDA